MSRLFRLPKYIPGNKLAEYHPGKLELSSKNRDWEGILFNRYSHPKISPGCPRPATTDHILAFANSGAVKGDYCINGDKWRPYFWKTHEWLIGQAFENDRDSRWHSACDENIELSVCYIHLSPQLFNKIALETMDKSPKFIEIPHRFGFKDPMMLQLGLAIKRELECNNPYGKIFVETAANLLAIHVLRNYSADKLKAPQIKYGREQRFMRVVLEYINNNLDKDISLNELATISNTSTFHFAHLFKNTIGLAPHQYIMQQRIGKSKSLLRTTSKSVSEIAVYVGYSPSYFVQIFHREVGATPKAYRLQVMN